MVLERDVGPRPGEAYFIGPLRFDAKPGDDYVLILTSPLEFVDTKGEHVTAPAGMQTDGASVGRLLRIPLLGLLTRHVLAGDQFTGPFRWPAVNHDGEYARAEESEFWPALRSPERAAADRRIFEGARCRWIQIRSNGLFVARTPAPWWRAAIVHFLLRAFGWLAWIEDSRAARSLPNL